MDLVGHRPFAVGRTVLPECIPALARDDAVVGYLFALEQGSDDCPEHDVEVLAAVPRRAPEKFTRKFFRGAVRDFAVVLGLDGGEILDVVYGENAKREFFLIITRVSHDLVWRAVEVSVDFRCEGVRIDDVQVCPHKGRNRTGRNLVDRVIFVGWVYVYLPHRSLEC